MISKILLFCIFLPGLQAATIFTTGPDVGNGNVPAISSGYAVSDMFALTSKVILNQVTFDDWAAQGTTPTSTDWEITSQPNAGVLFSATAATLSNTLVRSGVLDNDNHLNNVYNSSFQTPAITLGPGTYWLLLDNCSPADACSWGLHSGAGAAQQYLNGVLDANNLGTESFTLSGSVVVAPTGAPEPSRTFLAGGLFLAAVLAGHKRVYRLQ